MNASFLNPFHLSYPTAIQTTLLNSGALLARFDPTGRLVAAGTWNGVTVVWDLHTRAIVRWCEGHAKKKAITSVDWSRNSRFLLTSGKDWNVVIWDLDSRTEPLDRKETIRFDQPVASAAFHPRNCKIVLVVLASGEAFVVDTREKTRSRTELCEVLDETEDEAQSRRSAIMTARFDPTGKHIFAGTSSGSILVFNTRTAMMVGRHKIPGAGALKHLVLSKTGALSSHGVLVSVTDQSLLTNSSDRILRQFSVPTYPNPAEGLIMEEDLEPTLRLHDPINRMTWNAIAFSPDGEWVAGGAADPAGHKIFIWDMTSNGQFTTALDGGRELLVDVDWHPTDPYIASTTKMGDILIWHCPSAERWGAFAGGFEEVDENVEYDEKEDEFDIEDEEEMQRRQMEREDELVDVDEALIQQKPSAAALDDHEEDAVWADDDRDTLELDMDWQLPVVMEED